MTAMHFCSNPVYVMCKYLLRRMLTRAQTVQRAHAYDWITGLNYTTGRWDWEGGKKSIPCLSLIGMKTHLCTAD